MDLYRFAMTSVLLTLMTLTSACVVSTRDRYHEGYREGYYDREHHRWYHEHGWRDCADYDEHCR